MPELPDVELYLSALRARIEGETLEGIRLKSPFLLRSVEPKLDEVVGCRVEAVSRIGKRIVWSFGDELYLVFHLMIAGRFQWRAAGSKPPGRIGLASFDFADGTLHLTEASKRKRAMLHVVRGEPALADFDRGGLEVLDASLEAFAQAVRRESHSIKRCLTDPRLFSGIGNAYSDEILHRARLSPLKQSRRLSDEEIATLHSATIEVLREWTDRLQRETGNAWPTKVTAFREGMAVHGRYGEPCPDCGSPVQRIRYAENECNYCAACQNDGKIFADRVLSKLLKDDWPRDLQELEERQARLRDDVAGDADDRDRRDPPLS